MAGFEVITEVRGLGWFISKFHLPAPSELIVKLLPRVPDRNLLPSFGAYYMTSLQRFRHANHRMIENIVISEDGSAVVELRVVAFAMSPFTRGNFTGGLFNPEGVEPPGVSVNWSTACDRPREHFRDFDLQIREIEKACSSFSGVAARRISARTDPVEPKRAIFSIELPSDPTAGHAFALSYTARFQVGQNGFVGRASASDEEDNYGRNFDWPCYCYTLPLALNSTNVVFARPTVSVFYGNAPHEEESARIKALVQSLGGAKELEIAIPYPLPGAQYQFRWEVWKS